MKYKFYKELEETSEIMLIFPFYFMHSDFAFSVFVMKCHPCSTNVYTFAFIVFFVASTIIENCLTS